MSVNYGAFKDFTNLSIALTAIWRRQFVEESAVASLFDVDDSTDASENTKGLGSFGLVEEKTGSEMKRKEADPLESNQYVHKTYQDYIAIPWELVEDGKYGLIEDYLEEYTLSYDRTWVYHMSSVFNNAFDSDYTGADGRALCVDSGRNGGKQQMNNKGTLALTYDAVKTTRKAMMKFKGNNGLTLMVKPDTLVVGTDLMDQALAITGSQNEPGSANNDTNTVRGLMPVVDPLIEGDNWFLVDSALAQSNLKWWWRIRPTSADGFAVDPRSGFDGELRQRGRMRYSFGWDDTAWIYGHEVSGS